VADERMSYTIAESAVSGRVRRPYSKPSAVHFPHVQAPEVRL
jgi:hypothetical protein